MHSLMKANTGDICTIQWLICDAQTKTIMENCHIKEGSTICVINKCFESIIIGSKERRIVIGGEVANRIKVSLTE